MIGANNRVPQIDADKRKTCRACMARQTCRIKALVQFESHELAHIDRELCRGCLGCLEECPFKAIGVE